MKMYSTNNGITLLKIFVYLLFCAYITSGCRNETKDQIITIIDSFYTREVAGDYRLSNKKLMTKELGDLIERASQKQAAESDTMKKYGSTEKPNMIEGDIFTSVFEGSTSHKIESISYTESKAEVLVVFTNSNYEMHTWKEYVLLKKEQGGWKINDVKYAAGKGGGAGTQDVLNKFLQLPAVTPHN